MGWLWLATLSFTGKSREKAPALAVRATSRVFPQNGDFQMERNVSQAELIEFTNRLAEDVKNCGRIQAGVAVQCLQELIGWYVVNVKSPTNRKDLSC